MSHVLVTGPPASGKSTLAAALAAELGLPLLAKDTLKHALVTALGAADVEEARRLGRAAVAALLAVAAEARSSVLDSVWVDRETAVPALRSLGVRAEVHCVVPLAELRRRYAARAASRPAGGFDLERSEQELWAEHLRRPVAGGWPVVEVDTTTPVDVAALAARLRGLP